MNYGLLTDARGCPVAVSVFEGNTTDSKTFMPAVQRVRKDIGVSQVVMVGDRGMISQKAIDEMRQDDGVGWITAPKSTSIRALVELRYPDYPDERLVATEAKLAEIGQRVKDGKLTGQDNIGLRVGRVVKCTRWPSTLS